MHGLVEVDCAADGGRRQHAEGAGDDAGFVGEDVAEEVLGEDDVEVTGVFMMCIAMESTS